MGSLPVTLFGLLDLFLEIVGVLMCINEGDWFEDGNAIALYSSLALDVLKFVGVIVGFVIACWADSKKMTPEDKRMTLTGIGIVETAIGILGGFAAIYISALIMQSPVHNYDFRALYLILFLGYALLKFTSFFGFAEFLKIFVRDAPSFMLTYRYDVLQHAPIFSMPNPLRPYQL